MAPGRSAADGNRLDARALLRSNDLFRGLDAAALEEIVDLGYSTPMRQGEILYLQGDPGACLFVVLAGEVRISASGPDGQELHLNTLSAGDVMGEIALMDGGSRTATATATRDGRLFRIDRVDFLGLAERTPDITWQLLQLLCRRVRWTSTLLADSVFLSPEARLAKRLLAIAAATGTPVPGGHEIRLSQTELAGYLNLARQFVNRMLQTLQSEGVVELGRGRMIIRDPDRLLRLSAG
ncbi:MAG: Crp/Fnr family transcriptional regulator [Pseudomonadales bacterium]